MGARKSPRRRRETGRLSLQKKTGAVVRVLSGEPVEQVSKDIGVEGPEIERWRDAFLAAGQERLKTRPDDPASRELEKARLEIERLTMENELLRKRLEMIDWLDIAKGLIGTRSAGTGKTYPITMLCEVFDVPRASLYAALERDSRAKELEAEQGG